MVTTCRNCGTKTIGPYCHTCGQSLFAGMEQPIGSLVYQLFENAFAIDSKTPATLIKLFARPGFLSDAYRRGHIDRYVHPVKLFWMTTLIFFALFIGQCIGDEHNLIGEKRKKEASATKQAAQPTDHVKEEFKTEWERVEKEVRAALPAGAAKEIADPDHDIWDKFTSFVNKDLFNYFSTFAPYVVFLFIPVFALLLALYFYRNKYYYMYHLVFAVHFHTFLFLFLSLIIAIDWMTPQLTFPDWLNVLLFFLPGIYFAIAIYQFYRPRKKRIAVRKAIGITFLYTIFVSIITAMLIILMLRFSGLWNDLSNAITE